MREPGENLREDLVRLPISWTLELHLQIQRRKPGVGVTSPKSNRSVMKLGKSTMLSVRTISRKN